jgi:hypothetical protein
MALPILSINPYPNVPNVLGVPALLRKVAPVLDAIQFVSHISNAIDLLTNAPIDNTWAIIGDAGTAITPDSFLTVDYRNSQRLVDYPIEKGGFESYNKVNDPFEAIVTLIKGGSVTDREAFISTINAMSNDLKLYTIVTPEARYDSVNLERYDYRREAKNGAYCLIVTLYFREIRVTAVASGNADFVAIPDAANTVSTGQVSALAQPSALSGALSGAAKVLQSVKNTITTVKNGVTTAINNGVKLAGNAADTALKGIVS